MRTGRVRTRGAFTALRQRGVRSRQRSVRVTYLPDAEGVRLAFAIGRPVGNAVTRNRLRRRLRAAFVELDPPPGTYLVSASPSATSSSFAALQQELRSAVADVTA